MSIWTQANEDAKSTPFDQVSKGRAQGFIESFSDAFETQRIDAGQFGVEYDYYSREQANNQRIRDLGGTPPPSLTDADGPVFEGPGALAPDQFVPGVTTSKYTDLIRALNEGDEATASAITAQRDAELQKLQMRYGKSSGILTSKEILAGIRQDIETRNRRRERDTTWGGTAGSLLGGMAGAFHPGGNPLNVLTAGVGGVGKTALMKIATEAGAQGFIEGVNQLTGVADSQQFAGREPQPLTDIAFAAAGGGILRGAGEGLGGAIRWFRHTPADPAPAPPVATPRPVQPRMTRQQGQAAIRDVVADIYRPRSSRAERRGYLTDMQHVEQQLGAWDGPRPWELTPPTATRLANPAMTPASVDLPRLGGETVDEIARRIDPETFAIYDKVARNKVLARQNIETIHGERQQRWQEKVDAENDKIDHLRQRLGWAKKGRKPAIRKEIDAAVKSRDDLIENVNKTDTPEMAQLRRFLMGADESVRDLAPAVNRAYARAQGKWKVYEEQRAQINQTMNEGRVTLTPKESAVFKDIEARFDELTPMSLADQVPELRQVMVTGANGEQKLIENDDPIDTVRHINEENGKLLDNALESHRTLAKAVVAMADEKPKPGAEPPKETFKLDGHDYEFKLDDQIQVEAPNGDIRTISIREALKEDNEYDEMLQAVTSCRI